MGIHPSRDNQPVVGTHFDVHWAQRKNPVDPVKVAEQQRAENALASEAQVTALAQMLQAQHEEQMSGLKAVFEGVERLTAALSVLITPPAKEPAPVVKPPVEPTT